jgi:hypothetical protein
MEMVIVPEQINTAYVAEVCTPSLANALCDLVALGPDYAGSAVFKALRFFDETVEYQALVKRDPSKLIHLCEADEAGVVRSAAQSIHAQQLLVAYSALPFPKPEFPLDENCVSFSSLVL